MTRPSPNRLPRLSEVAAELGRGIEWLRCVRVAMGLPPRSYVTAEQVKAWYLAHPYFNSHQVKDGVWTPPPSANPLPANADTGARSLLTHGSRVALLRLQAGQHEYSE